MPIKPSALTGAGSRTGVSIARATALLAGALLVSAPGVAHADDWNTFGLDLARSRSSAETAGSRFDAGAWQHQWTKTELRSYWPVLTSVGIADGYVAFATQRNTVRVLNETDGSLVWQAQAGGAVFASPALWHGLVFVFGVDQQLYALRLTDGSVVWKKDLGAMGYASPVVTEGDVLIATGVPTPRVWRINALTGETRWQSGEGVLHASSLASLAIVDGHVLVSELEGHYHSFALADGKWQWTTATEGRSALSSPLVVNGRVYLLPGGAKAQLFAVDLATGAALDGWPLTLPMPDPDAQLGTSLERSYIVSSPAGGSDGILLSVRSDDRFAADPLTGQPTNFLAQEMMFAVDPEARKVMWSTSNGRLETKNSNEIPNYEFLATPALYRSGTGERLIAATSSVAPTLRVFSLNGDERWSTALAGPTRSSPVFANGQLVVATDAGTVQGFLSGSNRPPLAPSSGLSPTAGAGSDAARTTLHWNASVEPEGQPVRYTVRIDDDGEVLRDWDFELTTAADQLSLDLPALTERSTYTFAVRARDSQGAWSAWSAPASFIATNSPTVSVDGQPAGSLGAAIAAAQSGSMIRLGAGRFDLSNTLRVPPGVSLVGAGPHLTVLNGAGLAVAVAPGAGSEVRQVTVTGAHVGVSVDAATGVHLRNVILRDNDVAGLDVAAAGAADLVSGTLVRNGIAVRAAGNTVVRNALINDNGVGLQGAAAALLTSQYNNVFQNRTEDYHNVVRAPTDLATAVAFSSGDNTDLRLSPAQPTTDHGDPADEFSVEPAPNGHRINIGAFGNTEFAELSATTGTEPADGGATATPDAAPNATPDAARPTASDDGCACTLGGGATSGSAAPPLSWLGIGLALLWRRRRRGDDRRDD